MKKFIRVLALLAGISSAAVLAESDCKDPGMEDGKTKAVLTSTGSERVTTDWSGPEYICNAATCNYAYEKSETMAYSLTINWFGVNLGKTVQSWIGFSISATKSISSSFTFRVDLVRNDKAKPALLSVRRKKSGYYLGEWERTGARCSSIFQRPVRYASTWNPNRNGGTWGGDVVTRGPYVSYIVNGKLPKV